MTQPNSRDLQAVAAVYLPLDSGRLAEAVRIVLATAGGEGKNTHRAYARALRDFIWWYGAQGIAGDAPPPFTRSLLINYRNVLEARGITASSINQRLAPIKGLARELAFMGVITGAEAAGIADVHGVRQEGIRTGHWLTHAQAQALLLAPDARTRRGLRDRAIIAVFLGAGLRRDEMSRLGIEHVQQREGRWALVNIQGKRGRIRTVPIAAWVYVAIDEWLRAAEIQSGAIFRPVLKGDHPSAAEDGMTDQAIRNIVKRYLIRLGLGDVAPHDLRRTFAKLAQKGGAPIQQIQFSLGHQSVTTTEKYLGTDQSFTNAPSDVIALDLSSSVDDDSDETR